MKEHSAEYPRPAQHPEFRRFEALHNAWRKAREAVKLLEDLCEAQRVVLGNVRAACDHDRYFLGEGRHGSEKGESFFECRVCGHRWSE